MRILFFSNHLRGPKGNAGARSWHQARCLGERHEVEIIIPGVDPVTAQPVTPDTFAGLPEGNVHVHLLPVASNDRSSLWLRAKYYLSAIPRQFLLGLTRPRPDIVLSMGLPITTLFVAWLTSLRYRIPFVVDVRDLPFETAFEVGYIRNKLFADILRITESFLLRRADAVFTNSPRYKPLLERKGVSARRITIALIGYDGFDEPSSDELAAWKQRLKNSLSPRTQCLGVYAGTVGHAFPVEDIIDGARAMKDKTEFGFVIVGDGQRLQEFREIAQAEELNVHFTGRVGKHDVAAICRVCDYCIYPANKGTFSGAILGNKVFDYLGAGKPVLYIGGDSAVWDLVEDLGAGLAVEPGDTAAFSTCVARLTAGSDDYKRLVAAACQLSARGMTARRSAESLRDALEVIGRRDGYAVP